MGQTLQEKRDWYGISVEKLQVLLEGQKAQDTKTERSSAREPRTEVEAPPKAEQQLLDIKMIESHVQTLNDEVETGARVIRKQIGGAIRAHLATAQKLPITFFRDGVKLGEHPFHNYESSVSQHLLRDILGGQFPFVLSKEHPDGVLLQVVDRTNSCHAEWQRGAVKDPLNAEGVSSRPAARDGRENFLAKLPEKVIREGRICEIRDAVAKVGVSRHSSNKVDGDRAEVSLLEPHRDADAPSTRIQVKLPHGDRPVFKMEYHQTLGDLKRAVARWCDHYKIKLGSGDIELRSAAPPRALVDMRESLAEAGLTPSGTLYVTA